jgi:membrane protein
MVGLAALYRYAPQRTPPKWPWVTWGAALATVVWVLASVVFAVYAENFGRFNKTYGTLGGVVVLLLWMYLSSFAILLGAELNAELERQTAMDTTVGPERPMGEREAHAADTLGESRPSRDAEKLVRAVRNTLTDLNRPGRRKSRG